MTDVLLRLERLSKPYGHSAPAAVRDVSLEVRAGSVIGVVGESGSGKTTLARMMAGLLAPSAGTVVFQGTPLHALRAAALRRLRKHLQYVHQDPAAALDPRMRVRDILHEPLLIHTRQATSERLGRITLLLGAVGVAPSVLDRFPHELSGGQQRRIGLARILVLQPELIILDEPTAGLDLLVQASLLTLLQTLRSQFGLTMVLVTHDIGVVESMCDEVVVMFAGRIVERGTTQTVLNRPLHAYTQELLASRPRLDGARVVDRSRRRGAVGCLAETPEGCAFAQRCPVVEARCLDRHPVLAKVGGGEVACWAVPPPA